MAIDLERVKLAADVLGKLNGPERDFLKTYLLMSGRTKSAEVLGEVAEPKATAPKRRGPDPRGRYKCRYCDKVLPTKRGRGIHEKAHDKQTAPEGNP